jgi:hypothetical protein
VKNGDYFIACSFLEVFRKTTQSKVTVSWISNHELWLPWETIALLRFGAYIQPRNRIQDDLVTKFA